MFVLEVQTLPILISSCVCSNSVTFISFLTITRFNCVCLQHNPDAAPADERNELLQSGPWCFGNMDGDIVLECDGRAQRSQRAGIYELQVRLPAFLNTTVPFCLTTHHRLFCLLCVRFGRDGFDRTGATVKAYSSVLVW